MAHFIIFIPHHMIVAGYYGFMLDVRVSLRVNIQGLGAILGYFGHNYEVFEVYSI